MRRNLLHLALPAVLLVLFTTSLYLGRDQLSRISITPGRLREGVKVGGGEGDAVEGVKEGVDVVDEIHHKIPQNTSKTTPKEQPQKKPEGIQKGEIEETPAPSSKEIAQETPIETPKVKVTPSPVPVANGTILPAANITKYLDAILNGNTTGLSNLQCPTLDTARYESLKATNSSDKILYFFSLNLRNNLNLLPRLLGSIVEAIRFLGPQHCALSIVEGNSPDGTADVLKAIRPGIESLGAAYFFESSDIDPSKANRIGRLAQLRNLALQPLLDHADRASKNTTVLFLNDVAACMEDILELAHQRSVLGADMTCAMDWTYPGGPDPNFYDVWVARGLAGDTFFQIGSHGEWAKAGNLFWNEPETQTRLKNFRPFQVFACWNGATAFGAGPMLDDKVKLRFRTVNAKANECFQGEPELFCKDLWYHGYGKIAVIPTVNLEYSVANGKKIKEAKGFASAHTQNMDAEGDLIEWQGPPERVKCMPSFGRQTWRAWDEALGEQKKPTKTPKNQEKPKKQDTTLNKPEE